MLANRYWPGLGTVGLLRKGIIALEVIATELRRPDSRAARALRSAKSDRDSRVDYARADARALPFLEKRFDFVLSLYVLHHAESIATSLAEIARVLKPGGYLLLIDLIRPGFLPAASSHTRAGRDPDAAGMA